MAAWQALEMTPHFCAGRRRWMFRTVMSTRLIALIINRDLLKLGTPAADVNGDGKVKIAVYNGDEIFGNSAASDIISFARQLQTDPPVLIEQHRHSINAEVNSYNWAADLDRLTNSVNETTNTIDAVPDFIVAATFAQYYIPLIKTWQLSGYNQRVTRMALFHTFRIQSAVDALGALGNGQEGLSHVLLDDGLSGEVFAAEYQSAAQRAPVYRDAHYYDNAITLMLATWRAAHGLPVPTAVTGDQIRQAMLGIADVGAAVFRTGPAELTAAIRALDSGATINYEGASGPLDYDANQNIRNRLSHFRVINQKYVDLETYDCIKDANTATPAALLTACPPVAN